jgi:hypothetical protein
MGKWGEEAGLTAYAEIRLDHSLRRARFLQVLLVILPQPFILMYNFLMPAEGTFGPSLPREESLGYDRNDCSQSP